MPEEQNEETKTGEAQDASTLSNADVKSHPLFQKLTQQVRELATREEERESTAAKAKRESELKKAEEEGRYKDAMSQITAELEAAKSQHSKEILQRDLKLALSQAGFGTRGVDLMTSEYSSETHGDPSDYAKLCIDNEDNRAFLINAEQSRVPPIPPGKLPVGENKMNPTKLSALEKSNDPTERKVAYDYMLNVFKTTGELPD